MKPELNLPEGAIIDEEGVWNQVLIPSSHSNIRPALFLDRDGVVLKEVNYLHKTKDACLIPGAAGIICGANKRSTPVIIVTNQAGIAYGYYGWNEFATIQQKLHSYLEKFGAKIDGVFACPHHIKGKHPYSHPDHPSRKPNPGMLEKAAKVLNIDLSQSWIVGDKGSDIGAGKNAGLAGGIHVLTGHGTDDGERSQCQAFAGKDFKVLCVNSIADVPALP